MMKNLYIIKYNYNNKKSSKLLEKKINVLLKNNINKNLDLIFIV